MNCKEFQEIKLNSAQQHEEQINNMASNEFIFDTVVKNINYLLKEAAQYKVPKYISFNGTTICFNLSDVYDFIDIENKLKTPTWVYQVYISYPLRMKVIRHFIRQGWNIDFDKWRNDYGEDYMLYMCPVSQKINKYWSSNKCLSLAALGVLGVMGFIWLLTSIFGK